MVCHALPMTIADRQCLLLTFLPISGMIILERQTAYETQPSACYFRWQHVFAAALYPRARCPAPEFANARYVDWRATNAALSTLAG